jgi:hypothetical protein
MARSLQTAGLILVIVPTIEFGGLSLLKFLTRRDPGYMDNPLRRGLWTAGHAHAGVLVILALVGLLYLDAAELSEGMTTLVRTCLVVPPILMPLGFFLSVTSPRAESPNKLIWLVPLGGLVLAVGVVTLGIGLLTL